MDGYDHYANNRATDNGFNLELSQDFPKFDVVDKMVFDSSTMFSLRMKVNKYAHNNKHSGN